MVDGVIFSFLKYNDPAMKKNNANLVHADQEDATIDGSDELQKRWHNTTPEHRQQPQGLEL